MDAKAPLILPLTALDFVGILEPREKAVFMCPISQTEVAWMGKSVSWPTFFWEDYDDHVLLFQGLDHHGTSRIGTMFLNDFNVFGDQSRRPDSDPLWTGYVSPQPVLYPGEDGYEGLEWPGGVGYPRVVQSVEWGYVMSYTAILGESRKICIATSTGGSGWTKHGPAFPCGHPASWSNSGSIVCKMHRDEEGGLTAVKVNGKYVMYFGEPDIYFATSDDLIHWTPENLGSRAECVDERGEIIPNSLTCKPVVGRRSDRFDSQIVETGPPAILTEQGIMLLYHGVNSRDKGDPDLADGARTVGAVLLDARDPSTVLKRSRQPWLVSTPAKDSPPEPLFLSALLPWYGEIYLACGFGDLRVGVMKVDIDFFERLAESL